MCVLETTTIYDLTYFWILLKYRLCRNHSGTEQKEWLFTPIMDIDRMGNKIYEV